MKVVTLFALFVTVKCFLTLEEARNQNLLSAKEIYETVMMAKTNPSFYLKIGDYYSGSYRFRVQRGTAKNNLLQAHKVLTELSGIFTNASYDYINNLMKNYCFMIMVLFEKNEINVLSRDTIELIRLRDDQDYCTLRFVFDFGTHNVEPLYHIMYTLQSISDVVSDLLSFNTLLKQLNDFVFGSTSDAASSSTSDYSHHKFKTTYELSYDIFQMKQTIVAFSKLYCSATIPFTNKGLLNNTVIVDNPIIKSRFTEYFLGFERCYVYFSSSRTYMPSQKKQIVGWNCRGIMKSPEYGIEEYRKKVTEPLGTFDYFHELASKLRELGSTPEVSSDEESSDNNSVNYEDDPVTKETDGELFSLIALKHFLGSNNYYLNIVQYYNIVMEVMILVSIKEGKKILKGIKNKLSNHYPRSCNVNRVQKLRLKLFLFKSIFDNLVAELERKIKTIDNHQIPKKDKFVNLVDTVLNLMQTSKNMSQRTLKRNCSGVLNELQRVKSGYYGDNEDYAHSEFRLYYFNQPTLLVRTLYSYSKRILI